MSCLKVMNNNDVIDWKHLNEITGGDEALSHDFVIFFISNATDYIDELASAIESPEIFSIICHKLKGAAKSVGAVQVAKLSFEGEECGVLSIDERQKIITALKAEILKIQTL